ASREPRDYAHRGQGSGLALARRAAPMGAHARRATRGRRPDRGSRLTKKDPAAEPIPPRFPSAKRSAPVIPTGADARVEARTVPAMDTPMMAETVGLPVGDEVIEAYLARPLGAAPHPSVVVIHHMPGYDRATKEIVRTFAAYGHATLCPNL